MLIIISYDRIINCVYKIKLGDSSLSSGRITTFCDFLKGKECCKSGLTEEDALTCFIKESTKVRQSHPEVTKDFFSSDYFSKKVKAIILQEMSSSSEYKELKKLLDSFTNINDFDTEVLIRIDEILSKASGDERRVNTLVDNGDDSLALFKRCMLLSDGRGPIEYIKERYSDEAIAKGIIDTGGIGIQENGIGKGLIVENIMSLYDMFLKYLPDKAEAFRLFVTETNVSLTNKFKSSYDTFVINEISQKPKEDSQELSYHLQDSNDNDSKDIREALKKEFDLRIAMLRKD